MCLRRPSRSWSRRKGRRSSAAISAEPRSLPNSSRTANPSAQIGPMASVSGVHVIRRSIRSWYERLTSRASARDAEVPPWPVRPRAVEGHAEGHANAERRDEDALAVRAGHDLAEEIQSERRDGPDERRLLVGERAGRRYVAFAGGASEKQGGERCGGDPSRPVVHGRHLSVHLVARDRGSGNVAAEAGNAIGNPARRDEAPRPKAQDGAPRTSGRLTAPPSRVTIHPGVRR